MYHAEDHTAAFLYRLGVIMLFAAEIMIISSSLYADEPVSEQRVPSVIPGPAVMTLRSGTFTLQPGTVIVVDKEAQAAGRYLAALLTPATGYRVAVKESSQKANYMRLSIDHTLDRLGREGYSLEVTVNAVIIRAPDAAGLFYGIQTLRQLLPPRIESAARVGKNVVWSVPCITIEDKPRFGWRGFMLDCSRTFWDKEYIKRTIDLLALYKLNVFHLHLTDDQGWRVEIKKHPELTRIGSQFAPRFKGEHNGYYSQDDIREIVAYADERHVTIVPEIEMPGHCLAALTAYPELSCTGKRFEIHPYSVGPGIHEDVFCAGNDRVFEILEDVLSEVVELFPSAFIHIGGDECPKTRWKTCEKCQARIKAEGLRDEHELQSYFIRRIEKFLNTKNRRLIGWDEILEGGLAENATVMSWRGVEGGIAAARANHDVVMSPTSHCYFDYEYSTTSLEKVYSFEPVPPALEQSQARYILGAQANMWTHIARTEASVDSQVFPRLMALAEVAWSPKENRDFNYFYRRVGNQYLRLDLLGVSYHKK